MSTVEQVIVELSAEVDKANANVKKYADTVDREVSRAARVAEREARTMADAQTREAKRAADNQAREALRAAAAANQAARSTANATRNMGRRVSDVGVGLAMGQSPFMILAQQAPQVADALADTGGKAAKLAAFFAGPWGAALLAAGSIVGIFAEEMLAAGEESEDLVEKLKQNALSTERASDAQSKFEKTLYGAAQASAELNKRLKAQNATQLQVAQSAYNAAVQIRNVALQNLRNEQAAAKMAVQSEERAYSQMQLRSQGFTAGDRPGELVDVMAAAQARGRVAEAKKREADANKALAEAQSAVIQSRIPLLDMQVAGAANENGAATERYTKKLSALREEFGRTGDGDKYFAGHLAATKELEAAQNAGAASRKSERAATSAARKAATAEKRALAEQERESIKAAKELLRSQQELERSLESLTSKYQPAKASANEMYEALAEVEKLELAGMVSWADAIGLKLAIAADNAKRLSDLAVSDLKEKFPDADLNAGQSIADRIANDRMESIDSENAGPIEKYKRELEVANSDIGKSFEQLQVDGLQSFNDGLADAIMGAKSLGDVFSGVARQIIADLVKIAVQKYITGAISSALFGGMSSGGSIQVAGAASGMSMKVKGNGGTDKNLLSLNGKPMARVSMGERIDVVPNGRGGPGGSGGQNVYVDARGAVMNDEFAQMILSQSKAYSNQSSAMAYKASMRDAPGAVSKMQRYGA